MTALEATPKSETVSELTVLFDLLPLELSGNIIGDNFKKPDKLKGRGFVPVGFQMIWQKEMEIGGSKSEIIITYSPGLGRPVQSPDIKGEARQTVTDWYAEVLSKTGLESDAFVVSAEAVLKDTIGDLFQVTPGKIG